jgi:GR25 family glycosyltransferase involved in LPS biosynthesis
LRTRILLFFLFYCIGLQAKLEDHFKTAENKSGVSRMRNIDYIYLINLDKRPEKFSQSAEQLIRYGIIPYRFSAVNGWELSLEAINDVGLKFRPGMTPLTATAYPLETGGDPIYEYMSIENRAYFVHGIARGTIGCALSHLSVLKDAWEAGYGTIWVLEDDIQVLNDPHVLSDLIDKLDALVGKSNWDVLFTDQDYRISENEYMIAFGAHERPDMDCSSQARYSEKYTLKRDISSDFRQISARFGTHSMIIRRSGIKKLLEFFQEHMIFLPYDLDNYLHPDIHRYCLKYDIVTNLLNALSDNSRPLYTENDSKVRN